MKLQVELLSLLLGSGTAIRKTRRKAGASLLLPVNTDEPSKHLFPPSEHPFHKKDYSSVPAPVQTNKWWGNFMLEDTLKDRNGPTGAQKEPESEEYMVFPDPYTLKFVSVKSDPKDTFNSITTGLEVMSNNKMKVSTTRWYPWSQEWEVPSLNSEYSPDFVLTSVEGFKGMHNIVKEDLFGVHVEMEGKSQGSKITLPLFTGMAYMSAQYTGDLTPRIESDDGTTVEKVESGVWKMVSGSGREWRLYALTSDGKSVDDSFEMSKKESCKNVNLNKPLNGWFRVAFVNGDQPKESRTALDKYSKDIVTGVDLEVEAGLVKYLFKTNQDAPTGPLHYGYIHHQKFLTGGAKADAQVPAMNSRIRGPMTAMTGTSWEFAIDIKKAMSFKSILFDVDIEAKSLESQLEKDWATMKYDWRTQMHLQDNYFQGKGMQKVGQICQLLKLVKGANHSDTLECASHLKSGFKCLTDRPAGGVTLESSPDRNYTHDRVNLNTSCASASSGFFYDTTFGGLSNRWSNDTTHGIACYHFGDVFGGTCYNDHHYHSGYYVLAGALLVDLLPEMAEDKGFVDYIEMLMRDVNNPSKDDKYFPQFRSYDWFVFHSWSRGLPKSKDGKDQESASEELNFHLGAIMWGHVLNKPQISQLAATQLTFSSEAIKQYFFTTNDNEVYPPEFAKKHVTGIYFQNTAIYATWFGFPPIPLYIHGIQMLPLTPALDMTRTVEHSKEEWHDQLQKLTCNPTKRPEDETWKSLILTGNLATWAPRHAERLFAKQDKLDDGLTRVWADYWILVKKSLIPESSEPKECPCS